jgi:two-component system, chemotaxis family, response regulator Rcp1
MREYLDIETFLSPIVVVEDHPLQARLIRRALEREAGGRPVEVIPDGVAAAKRLHDPARPVPALLVFDLDVPGRSGHELLAECARDPRLSRVPTAVVTSSPAPDDRERSLALGASLHVGKPRDVAGFAELADRLGALIGPPPTAAAQPLPLQPQDMPS